MRQQSHVGKAHHNHDNDEERRNDTLPSVCFEIFLRDKHNVGANERHSESDSASASASASESDN
ncbi:MAG: hypothetical protein ABSB77_04425 [Xanthobacteraceae bacterium]|jgi:hypothetical protein